jgi:hypothetical protein
MAHDPDRPAYRPTSRVAWPAFLSCSLLVLVVGVAMGYGLSLVYAKDFYVPAVLPLEAAAPALILVWWSVGRGKCRSRLTAVLLGVTAGAVFYLSAFYFDLARRAGFGRGARLDRLPDHIRMRMATDDLRRAGKACVIVAGPALPAGQPPRPKLLLAILYPVELALICLFGAAVAVTRAGRPFCEGCGHWMVEESLFWATADGRRLLHALDTGRLAQLAAQPPPRVTPTGTQARVSLHYCPWPHPEDADRQAYLTVAEAIARKGQITLRSRCRLGPAEAAALVPLFPALSQPAGPSPAAAPSASGPDPSGSEVEWVPSPYDGKVHTAQTRLVTRLLVWGSLVGGYLWPLGVFVAYAGLCLGPAAGAFEIGGLLVVAGFTLAHTLVWSRIGPRCAINLAARYEYRLARSEIRQRPDYLVDPDDPEAIYVEVIARRSWNDRGDRSGNDCGFLQVDLRGRRLLFEGDRRRFRLSAEALVACEVEAPHELHERVADPLFFTIVRAHVGGRLWELPLCPLEARSRLWQRRAFRENAEELQRRIAGLLTSPAASAG